MKRLLLALVSVFVASATHAAPVTYGFYQGGYAENAFVAGYFRGEDLDGDGYIEYLAQGLYPSGDVVCLFDCEVSDYFMSFSGNSAVAPFVHRLPALAMEPEGDVDDVVGIRYRLGSPLLPTDFSGEGFIGSQNWTILPSGVIDNGIKWTVNILPDASSACELSDPAPCGLIGGGGGTTSSEELVRVFRVPEPATLTLIGIALVGLAFTRRRGMSFA